MALLAKTSILPGHEQAAVFQSARVRRRSELNAQEPASWRHGVCGSEPTGDVACAGPLTIACRQAPTEGQRSCCKGPKSVSFCRSQPAGDAVCAVPQLIACRQAPTEKQRSCSKAATEGRRSCSKASTDEQRSCCKGPKSVSFCGSQPAGDAVCGGPLTIACRQAPTEEQRSYGKACTEEQRCLAAKRLRKKIVLDLSMLD